MTRPSTRPASVPSRFDLTDSSYPKRPRQMPGSLRVCRHTIRPRSPMRGTTSFTICCARVRRSRERASSPIYATTLRHAATHRILIKVRSGRRRGCTGPPDTTHQPVEFGIPSILPASRRGKGLGLSKWGLGSRVILRTRISPWLCATDPQPGSLPVQYERQLKRLTTAKKPWSAAQDTGERPAVSRSARPDIIYIIGDRPRCWRCRSTA